VRFGKEAAKVPRNTADIALFAGRTVLGGYIVAHGAHLLFGSFDGPGIDAVAAGFEHRMGLRPGAFFARVAALSELAGGALTVAGALEPMGPVLIAGTMAVASAALRRNGPFTSKGGYELPLTDLAIAVALIGSGPGRLSFDAVTGTRLPRSIGRVVLAGAAAVTGVSLAMVLRATRPAPPPQVPPAGPVTAVQEPSQPNAS
jgi:putative oxidoreductase